jgi:hypothetical protein
MFSDSHGVMGISYGFEGELKDFYIENLAQNSSQIYPGSRGVT